MIIHSEQASGKCDSCGKGNATLGCVAQGATGRWCEVMWICEDCGPEDPAAIKTAKEARAEIEASGNGWPEF